MNFIANIMVKSEGKAGKINTEKNPKKDNNEIDFEIWVGRGEKDYSKLNLVKTVSPTVIY